MALANLNINVNTNVNNSITALTDFKTVANASMFASSQSVDAFQKKAEQTAAAVNTHAKDMSKAIDTSSVSISKSAALSSSSISDIGVSAESSCKPLDDLNKALVATNEKAKEQTKTFSDQAKAAGSVAEGWIKNKIEIAAVAVIFGVAVAGAFAFYETLKTGWHILESTAGFIKGLFTGESYKSANIDALITMNKEVLTLQESLQMTASDANALNDALQRLGVNKSDVTAVQSNLDHGKGAGFNSELDRLGVKTQDSSGNLLNDQAIIKNALAVLDTYTEGWDRNQAALALGLGSYAQMTAYLRINQEEVQASKDRLNDYNLGIGPETQEAVSLYQASMLRFNNETRLMGDGFKRVYADMVMPAYTLFADAFAEGWPSIVNGTRHLLAAFVSMGYGIKEVFDILWDSTAGTFKAIWAAFGGTGAAIQLALVGDFKGAIQAFEAGYDDAAKSISDIGTRITNDSIKNLRAMQLAQGLFNKDKKPAGMAGSGVEDKKAWEGPPAVVVPKISLRSDTSAVNAKYLEYSKAFEERAAGIKINANNLQLEKDKQSYDWGLMDYKTYLNEKLRLTLANISLEKQAKQTELDDAKEALKTLGRATDSTGAALPEKDDINRLSALTRIEKAQKALNDVTAQYAMGVQKGGNELDIKSFNVTRGYKDQMAALADFQGNYEQAALIRKKLDETSIAYQALITEAMTGNAEAEAAYWAQETMNAEKYDTTITGGLLQSLREYKNEAMDTHKQIKSVMDNALSGMTDAFVKFAETGKMNWKSLETTILEGLLKIAVQKAITGAGSALGSAGTAIWAGISGAFADGGYAQTGKTYLVGERGPELFTPGASGMVSPNSSIGGGGSVTQHITIDARGADQGVEAKIQRGMQQAVDSARALVMQDFRRGGPMAKTVGVRA